MNFVNWWRKKQTSNFFVFASLKDLIPSEDEDEKAKQSEMEFLKSLSVKQKRRLLR
jgi:hypothetical protein